MTLRPRKSTVQESNVSFTDAVQTALIRKYLDFDGRGRRSECWWFALFTLLVGMLAGVIDLALDTQIVEYLVAAALLLPGLAVGARRLHDTGRPGAWLLLLLIPFVGWLVLVAFFVLDSEPGANQYGPNPKSKPPLR